jgi:hypothetical protein
MQFMTHKNGTSVLNLKGTGDALVAEERYAMTKDQMSFRAVLGESVKHLDRKKQDVGCQKRCSDLRQ